MNADQMDWLTERVLGAVFEVTVRLFPLALTVSSGNLLVRETKELSGMQAGIMQMSMGKPSAL